jgi:hypothetical protein
VATLTDGDPEPALARERELWEAYAANDRGRLAALVHPLALDVGPGGAVLDRERVLDAVARMEIASYSIVDLTVRTLGEVEVVTYRAHVDGAYGGAPFPTRDVAVTSVWAMIDRGWRLVHRHESAAGLALTGAA